MYESGTRLAQEVADDVRSFIASADEQAPWRGARVFQTPIRRNIKLAECPSFGKTILDYAPTSHGAEDYLALAREVLAAAETGAARAGSAASTDAPTSGAMPVSAAGADAVA